MCTVMCFGTGRGKVGDGKYPPAVSIDLRVDDSEGVAIEGTKFGFQVIVVETADQFWVEKVLEAVPNL